MYICMYTVYWFECTTTHVHALNNICAHMKICTWHKIRQAHAHLAHPHEKMWICKHMNMCAYSITQSCRCTELQTHISTSTANKIIIEGDKERPTYLRKLVRTQLKHRYKQIWPTGLRLSSAHQSVWSKYTYNTWFCTPDHAHAWDWKRHTDGGSHGRVYAWVMHSLELFKHL